MSTGAAEPYVTDEYIYSMSPQDFPALVPRSNIWGYGADGTIAAADPWTLHSVQNDFVGMDLRPGMLVRFLAPKTIYGSTGEIYAIDAIGVASVHEITARRIGAVSRAGEPPGDDTDLAGITFDVITLRPQIEQASSQIDARLAIGYVDGRGRADLSTATRDQIRTLCAFMVLRDQYLAMAASMNEIGAGKSTFSAKSKEYGDRVNTLIQTMRIVFVQEMESVNRRRISWTFRI